MKLPRSLAIAAAIASLPLACATALASPETLPAGSGGRVATDPVLHRVFVTHRDQGTVSVIDLARRAAVATIDAGVSPGAMISNSATSRLYVLDDGDPGALLVLDAASGTRLARIELGAHPTGLAADFTRAQVYVSNAEQASLSIVDAVTNTVIATVSVGRGANGIAVDRARGVVYVSNALDDTVSAIDPVAHVVTATAAVGRNPGIPAVDGSSGRVVVPALDDGRVMVFDSGLAHLMAALPTGAGSTVGVLSPAYRQYFLPNASDASLSVIDVDSLRATTIDAVGPAPTFVAVDEDGSTIFVTSHGSTSVALVDPAQSRVKDVFDTTIHRPKDEEVSGAGAVFVRLADDGSLATPPLMVAPNLVADTAIAAEYFDADLGLFFHTSDAGEKRLIDDGLYGDAWQRTESYFRVWTAAAPGRAGMCRFFDFGGAPRTSHAYAYGADCDAARASGEWSFESVAYYVAQPAADDTCAAGTEPLYRLSRGAVEGGTVFRYTASATAHEALHADGWIDKGVSGGTVFACTPALGAVPIAAPVPGKPRPPITRGPVPMLPRPR